jgi:uncharacterized protein GlcG (DUF336 family)
VSRDSTTRQYFGIQQSNYGTVVILRGGLLIKIAGKTIGAIGASAGTAEQDIAVAEAAIAALTNCA